jgi:uncharacterized protein YecE (DUF72 family)
VNAAKMVRRMHGDNHGWHGFVDGPHADQVQAFLSARLFERGGALALLRVRVPFGRGRLQLLRHAQYNDDELDSPASQIIEISKAVELTHVVSNTNYEDQGQKNALKLMAFWRRTRRRHDSFRWAAGKVTRCATEAHRRGEQMAVIDGINH